MNNACPSCGAVYGVQPQHVGRRITCKKCNSSLIVTVDGLQLEGAAPPPPPGADPLAASDPFAGGQPSRRRPMGNPFAGLGIDVSSIVFGVGVFLTLLFLFLPLIDAASATSRQADINAENNAWSRVKQADRTAQKAEAHDERVKELTYKLQDATVSRDKSLWWYRWGMMFAFLVLAAGCIGYMAPSQATYRRILGVVVLGGMLLAIIYFYLVLLPQSQRPGGPPEGGNEPGLGAQFK
jgi:hypothetical protein